MNGNEARRKATDEQLLLAYQEANSVWAVAKKFGMCGQTVHGRLERLGALNKMNFFNAEDISRLKKDYLLFRAEGRLDDLAKEMGRTKQFICRQAKALGLTDRYRKATWSSTWKYISEEEAGRWFDKLKKSSLGMTRFCMRHKIDDLGFARTMKKYFPAEYESLMELKAPKTSRYRRGRQFEYRVRDYFKARKFIAFRSPASKGPVDILCLRKGEVLFIQCKVGGQLGCREWNNLFDLAKEAGAVPLLAFRENVRDLKFKRLIGKKDGTKKPQPFVPFEILEKGEMP